MDLFVRLLLDEKNIPTCKSGFPWNKPSHLLSSSAVVAAVGTSLDGGKVGAAGSGIFFAKAETGAVHDGRVAEANTVRKVLEGICDRRKTLNPWCKF